MGFFKSQHFQAVTIGTTIITLTSELQKFYGSNEDGIPNLAFSDAIHLATAIESGVSCFYTLDGCFGPKRSRRMDLLPLNGNVAGRPLTIQKPSSALDQLEFFSPSVLDDLDDQQPAS